MRTTIRFQHGGAYISDIETVRSLIRANGKDLGLLEIDLHHPNVTDSISVFINMSYQYGGGANASLYLIGFKSKSTMNSYQFKIDDFSIPDSSFIGSLAGDYTGLNYAGALPTCRSFKKTC